MSRPLRLVAAFRPFPPESELHREMAAFDWMDALRMLHASGRHACQCDVRILTDVDTELPVPTLRYETQHRRLMLWILEVCLRYLESDDFDRDTIALDCDQLIFGDLAQIVTSNADLVVCIRPTEKHKRSPESMPLLNGVQVWRHAAKKRLVAFYRQALVVAEALPEDRLVWGADTDALRILLEPLDLGLKERAGLRVHMVDAATVIETMSELHARWMQEGSRFWPSRPVFDFRWTRKIWMRPVFDYLLAGVVA